MIKNKKIKVAVLMGGPSSEREVSLITGKAVFDNLDRKKYQVSLIEMDKQTEVKGRRKNNTFSHRFIVVVLVFVG